MIKICTIDFLQNKMHHNCLLVLNKRVLLYKITTDLKSVFSR